MSQSTMVLTFITVLPVLLVSLVLHEVAHGWAAAVLGDPTARSEGRLSLNPIRHLDPLGSLMLVVTFVVSGGGFFFGWAKPVPIDPRFFKDPQRGMMLVGLAGPLTNLLIALAAAGLMWLTFGLSAFFTQMLVLTFFLNIVLALLNMIPVPPLDGSRVLGGLLPRRLFERWLALDRYGNYVFFGLVVLIVVAPGVFDATIGAVLRWSFNLLPGV